MLLEQKISDERFNINTVCEVVHENRTMVLGAILDEIVLSHQERKLKSDLGPRYARTRVRASFACPGCHGRVFARKGKRLRVFTSVLGKTQVPISQVRCVACNHRFCPYKDQIGLTFRDRISHTLKQRQLELTCQISYKKASCFLESCLGVSASPMAVRKEIDNQAEAIRRKHATASARDQVVYVDSTKVKAGSKKRGVSIHLAVTAEPGRPIGNRATMRKRLLFLKTGTANKIKTSLKSLKAKGIVHDGDMDLTACAPLVQRCLWHLPHQLRHFLWQDGLPFNARKHYVSELIEILHLCTLPSFFMKLRYRSFLHELKQNRLINSYTHLLNAEHELTTSRDNRFHYHTTAPVERLMREINRRVDIGVRWSIPGVENLLLVKTFIQLNKT